MQVNVPAVNGSVTSSLQRRRCIPLHCVDSLWGPLATTSCGVLWPEQNMVSSGHNKLWGPLATTNYGVLRPQQTVGSSGHNKLWGPLATTNYGFLWPQQTVGSSGHNKLWCPLATTNYGVLWLQTIVVLILGCCCLAPLLPSSSPAGAQRLSCQISIAEQ